MVNTTKLFDRFAVGGSFLQAANAMAPVSKEAKRMYFILLTIEDAKLASR